MTKPIIEPDKGAGGFIQGTREQRQNIEGTRGPNTILESREYKKPFCEFGVTGNMPIYFRGPSKARMHVL